MNYDNIEKIRKRTSELMKIVSPSIEEKKEIDEILNLEPHPRINDLKIALLQVHYKLKLKTESENFHLYKDKYYFRTLVFMRIDELNEAKYLSPKDAKDLIKISMLKILATDKYLLLKKIVKKFQNYIDLEDQISLCEDWINTPRYQETAIELIFRNYNAIIMKSQFLKAQIRLLSESHLGKRNKTCKNLICYQLKANFQNIEKRDRHMLMEVLVRTMTKGTERAARKLFAQKFNFIPVNTRNKILAIILNSKELPDYYIKSFLLEKYQNVSDENYRLIKSKLKLNENGM